MTNRLVEDILLRALTCSMKAVRRYQLEQISLTGPAEVKGHDGTLLTQCDGESGWEGKQILVTLPSEYDIHPEDSDGRTTPNARYRVWFDSLDGTRAFTNGLMTSTVILAVYEYAKRQVIWCAVGEPITGRLWRTNAETGLAVMTFVDYSFSNEHRVAMMAGGEKEIHVNNDPLDGQATVFVDLVQGFRRKTADGGGTRQILSTTQATALVSNIAAKTGAHFFIPGSNGLHQALVAMGREKCVGGITTAMGGPWDACGVALVLAAGGRAQAYRMDEGKLYCAGRLDPTSYDLVAYGNTEATVDRLSEILICCTE